MLPHGQGVGAMIDQVGHAVTIAIGDWIASVSCAIAIGVDLVRVGRRQAVVSAIGNPITIAVGEGSQTSPRPSHPHRPDPGSGRPGNCREHPQCRRHRCR